MEESSTVIPREIAKNKEIIPPPKKKNSFLFKTKIGNERMGGRLLGAKPLVILLFNKDDNIHKSKALKQTNEH